MYQRGYILSITYLVEPVDLKSHAITSSVDHRDGGLLLCTYFLAFNTLKSVAHDGNYDFSDITYLESKDPLHSYSPGLSTHRKT
jgi:hypothetical protein